MAAARRGRDPRHLAAHRLRFHWRARDSLFGAYFPSWLLAALLGIVGAVIVRLLFVRIGIDDALPVRLPVYVCIAAAIGFAISLLGFGR
ncbi:YtcA family lipoprotein [Ancylobacter dichloromethanicus]|uniref:YtcA family lipoprotein n=1 Tax=Ancylobacter dichloromethanicus TaxID=518825 RepID=UPI00360B8E32